LSTMETEASPVGITTTVPVEVVFAAGLKPVDLNNAFVSHPARGEIIERALAEGFPQSTCAWLKGIFGTVLEQGPRRVIGVMRGDCSGTGVLLEALEARGVEVIPFSFPFPPLREDMEREIKKLCLALGTTIEDAEEWRLELLAVRELLGEVDRLCWYENRVTGLEDHLWLVGSSDFGGDPGRYKEELEDFIGEARRREPFAEREGIPFAREVRLGYLGVPPITPEIFSRVERLGARFVFHEVARQFSMPNPVPDIVEQYLEYTYPYTLLARSEDINRESERRRLDGLVHYVQSFCHRNLEDIVFAEVLGAPLLTVECDCPGELGAAAMSRLESFIQVIGENL
jgi:benzoyl-CoA reductase/2-hydroxyglutaryl-CoA dehydratase subunit BcrC/BadD/HgdB